MKILTLNTAEAEARKVAKSLTDATGEEWLLCSENGGVSYDLWAPTLDPKFPPGWNKDIENPTDPFEGLV